MRYALPLMSAISLASIGVGVGLTWGVGPALIVSGGLVWVEAVLVGVITIVAQKPRGEHR
jgi:hypothetical protein